MRCICAAGRRLLTRITGTPRPPRFMAGVGQQRDPRRTRTPPALSNLAFCAILERTHPVGGRTQSVQDERRALTTAVRNRENTAMAALSAAAIFYGEPPGPWTASDHVTQRTIGHA